MRRILTLILLTVMLFLCNVSYAQQDCQTYDCTGQCGRFVDDNGDGYCDHGFLSEEVQAQLDAENEKESSNKPLIIALCIAGAAAVGGATAILLRKRRN